MIAVAVAQVTRTVCHTSRLCLLVRLWLACMDVPELM